MRLAEEQKGGSVERRVLQPCFVMYIRHLSNCVKKAIVYMSLGFSGEVRVLDVNLEIIGVKMIFKVTRLVEIT